MSRSERGRLGCRIHGRTLSSGLELHADVVVVGSGPAGATVARTAAAAGARVVILEAGEWAEPSTFEPSSFAAMSRLYEGMGASLCLGRMPVPYVQGRAVGGTSVINGAICWRLPRDVYDEWVADDPAIESALPWEELEAATDRVEQDLNVLPTDDAIAGPKNSLMAIGADALGLEHRPIRRNVRNCEGKGLCLQGCPSGNKLSMDRTYLLDAEKSGATVVSSVKVERLLMNGQRIIGVEGRPSHAPGRAGANGATGNRGLVRVHASRAVVLAASAVQTPALLLRNRVKHGPVGENFQCHPGVSIAGRFKEPVRMWEGATQGHEVTSLRHEGLKFEALGFGLGVLATRLDGVGKKLAAGIADMAHWADWGAAVRSSGRGRVRTLGKRTLVQYEPAKDDIRLFRRGLRIMGEMMFAAGAESVSPGVFGFPEQVDNPNALRSLEDDGPEDPRAYMAAATHLFGTCRMGSDPQKNVARLDFRHHVFDGLYIADSSVFPTNLGVNPQIPIMAVADICARRILA